MTDGFCPLAVTCPLPRALATTALLCRYRSHVWGGHAAFVLSGSSRLACVLQTRPCCHEAPACFSAPWPLCSFRLGFAFSGDGEPSRVPGPVCPRSLCPERSVPTAPAGFSSPFRSQLKAVTWPQVLLHYVFHLCPAVLSLKSLSTSFHYLPGH